MPTAPVVVSVFPFVPSDLKGAYKGIYELVAERDKSESPIWYPWDVVSGYMFRFPDAEQADAFLVKEVDNARGAFAVTDDVRPYLFGYFNAPRPRAVTDPIHRGLWVTLIRAYGEARMWYTTLAHDSDPYSVSLRHMKRLTEDSVRAGSAITLLSLSALG